MFFSFVNTASELPTLQIKTDKLENLFSLKQLDFFCEEDQVIKYVEGAWDFGSSSDYPKLASFSFNDNGVFKPAIFGDHGTSTEVDSTYIEITTVSELNNVRNGLSGKYVLMNDLNLDVSPYNTGSGWTPIGDDSNKFTGVFDGNGYLINNLFISRSGSDEQGLFGFTDGAIIRNIGLENVDVTGKDYVGGLVGYSSGYVSNSFSSGSVSGLSSVGGLVGQSSGGGINRSSSFGIVSGSVFYIGGLVGAVNSGYLISGFSSAIVSGTGHHFGGLAGLNQGDIVDSYSSGSVSGSAYVGGLVGSSYDIINTSFSFGSVSGISNLGGLVGNVVGGLGVYKSYYDSQNSGQSDTGKGEPKTTNELRNPINNKRNIYSNWSESKWVCSSSNYWSVIGSDLVASSSYNIKTGGNYLYLGDDVSIYDGGTNRLKTDDDFETGGSLRAGSFLSIGRNSVSDDDTIYFDNGSQYLVWENSADRFTFSNDLKINNDLSIGGDLIVDGSINKQEGVKVGVIDNKNFFIVDLFDSEFSYFKNGGTNPQAHEFYEKVIFSVNRLYKVLGERFIPNQGCSSGACLNSGSYGRLTKTFKAPESGTFDIQFSYKSKEDYSSSSTTNVWNYVLSVDSTTFLGETSLDHDNNVWINTESSNTITLVKGQSYSLNVTIFLKLGLKSFDQEIIIGDIIFLDSSLNNLNSNFGFSDASGLSVFNTYSRTVSDSYPTNNNNLLLDDSSYSILNYVNGAITCPVGSSYYYTPPNANAGKYFCTTDGGIFAGWVIIDTGFSRDWDSIFVRASGGGSGGGDYSIYVTEELNGVLTSWTYLSDARTVRGVGIENLVNDEIIFSSSIGGKDFRYLLITRDSSGNSGDPKIHYVRISEEDSVGIVGDVVIDGDLTVIGSSNIGGGNSYWSVSGSDLVASSSYNIKTNNDLIVGGGDVFIGSDIKIHRPNSNWLYLLNDAGSYGPAFSAKYYHASNSDTYFGSDPPAGNNGRFYIKDTDGVVLDGDLSVGGGDISIGSSTLDGDKSTSWLYLYNSVGNDYGPGLAANYYHSAASDTYFGGDPPGGNNGRFYIKDTDGVEINGPLHFGNSANLYRNGDSLKTDNGFYAGNNLFVGFESGGDDDIIYFDGTSEYLKWDNAGYTTAWDRNSNGGGFLLSDDITIGGNCVENNGVECDLSEGWFSYSSFKLLNEKCGDIIVNNSENLRKCEYFRKEFKSEFEEGEVSCIDAEHSGNKEDFGLIKFIKKCDKAYDKTVLSSINYHSTLTLGRYLYPVTLAGNIPVKVICDTPIQVGDPLVTSGVEGYAMSAFSEEPESFKEAFRMQSSIFAKALENCEEGSKTIRAWI